MPIFEFVCADCGKPFEELLLSASRVGEVTCPSCQSQNITKKISTFISTLPSGRFYSLGSVSNSSCSIGSV